MSDVDFDWTTETYPVEGPADLAQDLYDSGLLFLVNAAVLHHHGLALGVVVDDGKVTGLSLHRTSDPDGVWFDEEQLVVGRRKLREAGLIR